MTGKDSSWRQLNLTCTDWRTAEEIAVTALAPLLTTAQDAGTLSGWWFIRKDGTWRLRFRCSGQELPRHLTESLHGVPGVQTVTAAIYEPETTRFGGPEGMTTAHRLFAADSRYLLCHLSQDGPAFRREIPVILATRMLRAAGQDWYEQGDCWEQLAAHRRDMHAPEPGPAPETTEAMRALLSAAGDVPGSPLHDQPGWVRAFEDAGRAITALAAGGTLRRGQREVFTSHMIFMFNRHGVPAADQLALASAASRAVFGPAGQPAGDTTPNTSRPPGAPVTVTSVTTTASREDQARISRLRNRLADDIKAYGAFATPQVEAAFRTVGRHGFLPGTPLEEAYRRAPVVTQRAADGTALSSASSPALVAGMLEQLGAEPGDTVLEIGTATGYNAALLACLTGPSGTVVTIELDAELAGRAAGNLRRAGYPHIHVVAGDGALGYPGAAPYDGIIITAEAADITTGWWTQLKPAGRIVIPVRLHASGLTRAIGFRRTGPDTMTAGSALVCGFVPMRGSTRQDEQHIRLDAGAVLKADPADLPDTAALSHALSEPAHQRWTGIRVRHDEPAEHLDLWLAITLTGMADACFSRLAVTGDARRRGLADPAMRWAGAGMYHGGTLAYITARPIDEDTDELGITAHGPGSTKLTETALSLLTQWDRQRPAQPVITATRVPAEPAPSGDAVHLQRPCTTFTVTW
jgi:protein-L-isoaspartate(D-aspartate) O-methyltransferase